MQPSPTPFPTATQGYLPTTFLERGAAVPFTTPQLAGARARSRPHLGARDPLELLLPNPSGADGVYILPWQAIATICRPTVHDTRLNALVAAQPVITPAAIRAAARQVAAEGLAGHAARSAAKTALADAENSVLLANFDLLLAILAQHEPPAVLGETAVLRERDRPDQLQLRAQVVVAMIAPELGQTPDQIGASLEQLARLYSGIGVGANAQTGRLPTAVAALAVLRQAVADHVAADPEHANAATILLDAADLTLACTRAALAETQEATADMTALLRRWTTDAGGLTELLLRPDWLLDGWPRICAIWQRTLPAQRSLVLPELAVLAPTIPNEAGDLARTRRKPLLLQDWRTGLSYPDLIARNETLLADTL